ncbi:hypothetical protein [Cecembia lonarensis]|uniref:Uncharacterized protein n=1 Tax=Cecembia lonarensis (strain CCUG 58316 / KCTC 22772 / LW9) TaxID=1225176 RepID=K1LE87_CECL9|nr:hypothetical protein [Cecembia lonarensis]EKB50497.1 hypothetical protein B879_00879 [Cecembia lonarensis LW9]
MDENEDSVGEILYKNSGMRLEEWIAMVQIMEFDSKDKMIEFLMENEGLTHRVAHFIAFKAFSRIKRERNE